MRLKKSRSAGEEELIALLNEGYELLQWIRTDYAQKKTSSTFDPVKENPSYEVKINEWASSVVQSMNSIFPTPREANSFLNAPSSFATVSSDVDYKWFSHQKRLSEVLRHFETIITSSFSAYTDLPIAARLYIEDIDSFRKVRDVNPGAVSTLLANGRIELSENEVQLALEKILDVSFHKIDWGGETNDLYSSNVVVNGSRTATAFLLKGKGLKKPLMEIADCGKNGDQIIRLAESPAQLFVIQFIATVSEAVIKDIEGKVNNLRSLGKPAWFCVIDGQDTARLLRAYGLI